ncbi:MAG: Crp/Fnr family transcriptional regulator [Pacificimonas sp.]|nr:Crp/Fnr family transcriptional regulator [Pacificimonas sp.]
MNNSCFIDKLQHYLPLTPVEKQALGKLEEDPKPYEPGSVIFEEERDSADHLYVVQEGRVHTSTLLADGTRAILRISFPGDFLGTNSIPFRDAVSTAVVAVPSKLCRFPRKGLRPIFEDHPRIAALFYAVAMLENVSMQDRLKSVGRTEGTARVGALILESLCRLRITNRDMTNRFDMHMTQADMGDAVGLTNIHVNRCLKQLAADGLIERQGSVIKVLDEARLRSESHFIDRFGEIETDWFPDAR